MPHAKRAKAPVEANAEQDNKESLADALVSRK